MNLLVEMFLTVVFCFVILLTRKYIAAKKSGPYYYAAQNVENVPAFIRIPPVTPYPWELAYVPSKSTVVQNIVENVKQSLHTNMKG